MKFNKSTEQAAFVLIMLALQKDHTPVKSNVLSKILKVSDSYLKKILMKLSKANLITATASKTGGYILNKNIEQISLMDVMNALEVDSLNIEFYHLGYSIFDDHKHVQEGEDKIKKIFLEANIEFNKKINEFKLSELLHTTAYTYGEIDWEERISNIEDESN